MTARRGRTGLVAERSAGNRRVGLRPLLMALTLIVAACSQGPAPDLPAQAGGVQAVVTAHGAATDAGIAVLAAGGSAADAAVAIAATLSVVEPWFSSVLGGGTWALYFDAATGQVTSLDGVGPVGSRATAADYAARARRPGMHQAIVPGAWDGWMLWLERYGRLSLGDVLAPAIEQARAGFRVDLQMAQWLARDAAWILANPDTAAIYAPEGRLLGAGETVYQLALATTFEALVSAFDDERALGRTAALRAARDHFYRGPLAQAIAQFSEEQGGYLTLADLNGFEARIVDPLAIDYGAGIRVYQNPPNSQGITMLIALNILKGFDWTGMSPTDPDAIHLQVEALKLAFADRHHHVGDPERITVPVEELLSDEHAERQRRRIDPTRAMVWPVEDGLAPSSGAVPAADVATGTTTFHVVDRDGNAAAVTTSLGAQFYVIGDTGIHINNRMRFIALAEGDPNELTPGYKVRHTSNPYMALRDGRPYLLGGNTGADTQVQGQVQQFMSVVAFGREPWQAVAQPRFLTTAFPATTHPYAVGNTLQLEAGFSEQVGQQLVARGHTVTVGPGVFGVAHMLMLDEDGTDAKLGVEVRSSTSTGVVIPPSPE